MATTALIVIIIALVAVVLTYNHLVSLRNRVENGWKQIDVQLKRRHNLIPSLVETVKGAMPFERDTLERVMQARARAIGASSIGERMAAESAVSESLGKLFAVMENSPTLKVNENALQLQEELTTTENQLAFTWQLYNDVVIQFNTRQQRFPTSVIATFFDFKPAEYFAPTADGAGAARR